MKVTRFYTWFLQSAIFSGIAACSSIEKDTQNLSSFGKLNTTAAPVTTPTANGLELSLDDLWALWVGPVATASTTTVVEPTPIPSSSLIPPPWLGLHGLSSGPRARDESRKFPKTFMLGVAGAAYQIEGAAKEDGRGPTVWDVEMHQVPNFSPDNSTGDIADNNYYLYKQDIARLTAIGVTSYSFSIAWTRVLPRGTGEINELGIAFYDNIINTCIHYNLTPVATLYHFDMPAVLQNKYGGWLGEQIVDDFEEYARIVYSRFGDRVKHWFTINEPLVECAYHYPKTKGYFKNVLIPDVEQPFHCGRNILLAHARAYRLGKSIIPDSLITHKASGGYKIPLTNSTVDEQATQRAWDFEEGWFADPVFLTGDWPSSVKAYVSKFLPEFTDEQKQSILGSGDFFAEDAYTAQFYSAPDEGIDACVKNASNPLYPKCANQTYLYPAAEGGWLIGAASDPGVAWLHQTAYWVPNFLRYINRTWPAPHGIAISEFGFAEPFEQHKTVLGDILYDPIRSQYYHQFMESLLTVIDEGINLIGCWSWSFLDNLEWDSGFGMRFGLQYVNFSDPALPRHYKASFFEYVDMYNSHVDE